jgi:phage-related protein
MFTSLKNGISSVLGGLGIFIKDGFTSAISFITGLPAKMLGYGKDMIQGLINGITGMIGKVGDEVSSVASKIKNFLHFSVPDEGPLADYESWMPDFMAGLGSGITDNKHLVTNAIKGLSTDMTVGVKSSVIATPSQSNQVTSTDKIKASNGLTLNIANFVNNRKEDIEELAQELEMYRQMHSQATGGAY